MLYAVIDVGSNSVRLSLYETNLRERTLKSIYDRKTTVGLESYVVNGSLTHKGIERAIACLASYQRKMANYDIAKVFVFATACIRNSKNRNEVISAIEEATGLIVDLIEGVDEARYGFIGAMQNLDAQEGVLVDMGGASTEICVFENRKLLIAASLPFGSLSLFLTQVSSLLPDKDEQDSIAAAVRNELVKVEGLDRYSFEHLYGIGGSVRATSKLVDDIYYDSVKTRHVYTSQMDELLAEFSTAGHEQICAILRVVPDRIHTVVPGMVGLRVIARYVGATDLFSSTYGVREGYLISQVFGENC